uniref:Uncharacterized protein n=1 Tax=uncultured bacterium CSLF43 TaxID=1091575 RepID=G4WW20_9BACT|nr:hypothetical protein [uncultured bacterium CSLF43]
MFEIDREHPEYKSKRAALKRYRDLYAGGQEFLNNAAEYLIQRHKEPLEVYAERLQRVFYENYIGSIVDWYGATLFRREPLISYEGANEAGRRFFGELAENCDLRGSDLTSFLRKRLIEALVQGASYVLVDFPKIAKRVGTRAEEDELGASRAYLVGYGPENLTNWSYDDTGRFEWVVLRAERLRKDRPDQEWTVETTWTYYDKEQFKTYRRIAKEHEQAEIHMIDSGLHGLAKQRRVPLFQLELQEGLWLLNRAGSLQLEHFNKSNALSWALTMGLFATPVIYSDRKFNQMMGESYYIQLGPDDKFGWTEPEGRVYEIAAQNLVSLQEEIYRVCYLSQLGGPLNAATGQSGLSKVRDFSATQEVLRAIGDSVKDLTRRVLNAIEEAREDGLRIDVAGLDDFDIGDFSSDLQDAQQLLALGIDSPTLKKQIFRRLALKYLCDVRQSVKDEIAAEIDGAAS